MSGLTKDQMDCVEALHKEFLASTSMVGPGGGLGLPRCLSEPTNPPAFFVEKPQPGVVPECAKSDPYPITCFRRQLNPKESLGVEGYIYATTFSRHAEDPTDPNYGMHMVCGISCYRKSCAKDGGKQPCVLNIDEWLPFLGKEDDSVKERREGGWFGR